MRNCSKCNIEFEPSVAAAAKWDWRCNSCKAELRRASYARAKSDGTPYKQHKMPREWHAEYEASYYQRKDVKAKRAANKAKEMLNPDKALRQKVRRATRHAVANGIIERGPCEVCHADKVEAHHDDYAKPLDVRWLCIKHHAEHHARQRRSGEA